MPVHVVLVVLVEPQAEPEAATASLSVLLHVVA